MIKVTIEKVYLVKKGDKKIVVELCRSSDGKLFVVPIYTTKHVYTLPDGSEKEWEYGTTKAEEVDFMSLPPNIREALSAIGL
ncbi:MAG: hypothetical protein N3D82_04045 [Ignisphaera sp.]|nr:hypothetical protein [Ignisphaera sp.]MCX8168179.1 hypothetical protein [Ignisphaera sp.]MDW8085181.1 hypothetical protein [Ignisphaera sp.]